MKGMKFLTKRRIEAVVFLLVFFGFFGFLGSKMGLPNMMNTIMQTAYSLLLETVFYIMAITVVSGALGNLLVEFGVVRLIEVVLRPLMKPLYNLPGVAALGGVMTFLSDNPAIISLSKDAHFARYFKKYQLISLTNFGTAFGMGLVVIMFMMGKGYLSAALVGLLGAVVGSIVSTRLMQRFILKSNPELDAEISEKEGDEEKISFKSEGSVFLRFLNAILDGGKSGVEIGLAIIPGVLIISTVVMMLTFGAPEGGYAGGAYEGVALLPYLAEKINRFSKFSSTKRKNISSEQKTAVCQTAVFLFFILAFQDLVDDEINVGEFFEGAAQLADFRGVLATFYVPSGVLSRLAHTGVFALVLAELLKVSAHYLHRFFEARSFGDWQTQNRGANLRE